MVDLTDVGSWIKRIVYRIDRLEAGAQLENASITNGRLRFYGGLLQGLAGAVFEWIGSVVTRGPFSNFGPFRNEGKFTNIGELEQQGPSRFIGGVDIEGLARLLNDLLVTGGGSITIEPSGAGVPIVIGVNGDGRPAVTFAGGELSSDGDQVGLTSGDLGVYVGAGGVIVGDSGEGGVALIVTDDGRLLALNLPTIAEEEANAFINPETGEMSIIEEEEGGGGVEA